LLSILQNWVQILGRACRLFAHSLFDTLFGLFDENLAIFIGILTSPASITFRVRLFVSHVSPFLSNANSHCRPSFHQAPTIFWIDVLEGISLQRLDQSLEVKSKPNPSVCSSSVLQSCQLSDETRFIYGTKGTQPGYAYSSTYR
jgi:hypothetical protein